MNNNDYRLVNKISFSSNNYQIQVHNSEEIQRRESKGVQLFQRTKSRSGSKNYLKFQLTKSTNSNNNSLLPSMRRKSRTVFDFNSNFDEINIKEIYRDNEDNNDVPKLIQKFTEIKDCSILKYGIKPSIDEIEFSFCRTCDPNLVSPICLPCLKNCHKSHRIKKKIMKGEIRCACGERLHCISKSPNLNVNNISCQLTEWYVVSKLNFYYKTKNNSCLCMLCYNFCNNEKDKETIIQINSNDKKDLPNCTCNNEDVHQEKKIFFEKMEDISHKLDIYEYFNLLHPIQIVNMIFLSKKQFDYNYNDLIFLNEIILKDNSIESKEFNSFKKADFSSTNYFHIFKHLLAFIKMNKHSDITYYCKKAEEYFSFTKAKFVFSLMNNMKHNEKSFWILSSKFLELFHKIYLGNITQSFPKFKLNDLENFSSCLRWSVLCSNEKKFPESQEIINFLISFLDNINLNGFSCIEAMDIIEIISKILKKMSFFNLVSNGDMIRIIQQLEKIILNVKLLRKSIMKNNARENIIIDKENNDKRMSIILKKNFEILSQKEIQLYYNIIKLITCFYFCFNDRIIHSVLTDIDKYPNLDSIDKNKILFAFIKTDLGRALIRLNIRVLFNLQNFYQIYSKDEKFKKVMNYGLNILSCFLKKNDMYLLSLMQSFKKSDIYEKGNDLEDTDSEYLEIVKEKNKLEKCYKNYFIFENDIEDIIKEVNDSLDRVLGKGITEYHNNTDKKTVGLIEKRLICIIKSNYYFTLSKFNQILNFIERKKEKLPNHINKYIIIDENNENINNAIDKIFLFYFSFIYNSRDNSLLLLSNYIFGDLCKAPIRYGKKNFELFFESIKNIINSSPIIGNINIYLTNLFNYLKFLNDKLYSNINECLFIFLKILELFTFNIKSLNPEESINEIKLMIIGVNEYYKLSHIYFNEKSKIKEEEIHSIDNCVLIFMKVINDIFDFTNDEDKNLIMNLIKPEKVIYTLKSFNIPLNLRTELLRYIRKLYIDITYNENSNQLYANSIISSEDKLILLKTNPLISNFRYPTKFLSYFKDFLNISAFSEVRNHQKDDNQSKIPTKHYTFKFEHTNKIDEVESSSLSNKEEEKEEEEKAEEEKKDLEPLYSDRSLSKSKSNSNFYEDHKRPLKPCFDNTIYELYIYELRNIKEITGEIKTYIDDEMEILRNYFENGLFIPIIYFLKKSFVFSHCFTGEEMIKLYQLIIESCKLRLYIAEYKYDFWKEFLESKTMIEEQEKQVLNDCVFDSLREEEENFCGYFNNRGSLINGSFCINNTLNNGTVNSLKILKDKKFLSFDYTYLYNIFEQNILSLLKDRKENNYSQFFANEGKVSIKMIKKIESKIFPGYKFMSDIEKRIIRLYLLYKYCKNDITNENNSSIFSVLPEICLEHETNYRNLLIKFLVNNGTNIDLSSNKVSKSFGLLYKLLSLQTSETQNNLINIIGGNDSDETDLGFMTKFSEHLFKRITLLFIELFNPPDNLLDTNFICSYILIKIFKNLCEEHNNFFQCRLIKTLNYKYTEKIPMSFKEESKEEEESKINQDKESNEEELEKDNSKNIKFFDFFLHVLLKIILISEWDKLDYNDENYHRQNRYLYDIFNAILEMLNEIIQGNRPEFLNHLGNSVIENDSKNSVDLIDEFESKSMFLTNLITINGGQIEKQESIKKEKTDNFQYFVKNVTDFIFRDKVSLELLYKIRNDLMQFFTSILEEKNCNEEVQKFIIKYLNINRVFNSISSILKSYYIKQSSEEDLEKILKTSRNEQSNIEKNINIPKRQSNIQFTKEITYSEIFNLNSMNLDKNNTKMKLDYSSKIFPSIQKDYIRTMKIKENNIIFDEKLLDYYRNLYFSIKDFNQTNEFQLSNAFYRYIKIISVLNKSEEAKQLIEEAEAMSEERAKRKFSVSEAHKKTDKINSLSKKETFIIKKKTLPFSRFSSKANNKQKKFNKKLTDNNKLDESEFLEFNISNQKTEENNKRNIFQKKSFNLKKNNDKKMLSLINENLNEFDKDSIEHYYIIKFFESITTTVEVRTEGAINQTVIFTQLPEMMYLSKGTKSEFEREVNRDSEITKKNDLVRNVIYFQKEIKYYQNNHSNLSRLFSKIDFLYIQMGSYIYALLFNLLLLFTLNGDIKITFEEIEEGSIKSRRINRDKIQSLIDKSIYKWGTIYDSLCYFYVILNGVFIFAWIYFRMPLYYKIDRLKYIEENNIQNKKNLTFCQKIYIIVIMTIYDRDYILTLIYEFIFSLIGAIMERGEITYAFLLLPIIDLNNILKNIIVSIRLRYKEVALTFLLAFIIMYLFSNMAYFFFNKDFSQEIEYMDDNVCKTLIFCFLNTLDSGLRARGGIGDSGIRLSYSRNKRHYIRRLIMDDFFFILIVIIAIDLVFGIIIGAFNTLRDEEQRHSADRKNHCFICHVNKNTLEKNRQNFNEHRTKVHNIWNYVDYMMTLKFSDVHDLNAINSYASQKIENKDISWLPTYKDLKANGKNGKIDELEEELKVEDENVNKYFVKMC